MECTINQKQEDDMIPHVWFSPHVAIIYDVVLPVKFIVLNTIFITSWWGNSLDPFLRYANFIAL